MDMAVLRSVSTLFLLAILLSSLAGCSSVGRDNLAYKESRNTSGAASSDYGSMYDMAPMEAEEMFGGADGAAAGEAAPASPYKSAPGSSSQSDDADYGSSAADTDIPESGMLGSLEDWLNPRAWAAEDAAQERFIIRNGNIEMEIEDYDKSSAEVKTIAIRHNAVITDSQMQKHGDDMRVGWITLRVPGDKFQQCFDDLREVGEVKVQNVSSEDVSNEYVAGVSRMEALRTEHETLQGMLEDAREIQRTRGLGEAYSVLLDTQRRLSQVTTELQTVENRVTALRDRINRSTITVNLSERTIAPPPDEFAWGFGATFENAKKDLMRGIDHTVSGIIYFLVNGLIWWLIWLGIFFIAWKLFARRWYMAIINNLKAEQERGKAVNPK